MPDRAVDRPPATILVSAPAGSFRGLRVAGSSAVFAGLPFAQPPIGELRLRPPQPLARSAGERDATRFAPAPTQGRPALGRDDRVDRGDPSAGRAANTSSPAPAAPPPATGGAANSPLSILAAAWRSPSEISEDCLYLNVWTPDVAGRRPVIVWIYGGGFEAGSASPPMTDGETLSRLTDTVVVAINYRVGALGFGYWAGVGGPAWRHAGNLGLQDQLAALRWVQANIAAFGGDPANVTVAGQSAGSFCIGSLLAIDSARGLFAKAMLLSGSTRRVFPAAIADSIARDLLARLNVNSPDALMEVDATAIVAAQTAVIDSDIGTRNLPGGRSWGVVLDGELLRDDPQARLAAGGAREIPMLIGACRDEIAAFAIAQGAAFIPASATALGAEFVKAGIADPAAALAGYRARVHQNLADSDLGALRSAFLADAIYRRPASAMARAQSAAGGKAWTYLFSGAPAGVALGAFHGADLLYGFDVLGNHPNRPADYELTRDQLVAAWKAFAHDGDPGWPAYDQDRRANTRQFGGDPLFVAEPPTDAASAAWSGRGLMST